MNLVLVLQHRIANTLQLWFGGKPTPRPDTDIQSTNAAERRSVHRSASPLAPAAIAKPAQRQIRSNATPSAPHTMKPLRVVRVVENGQSRSASGRMVISGRMADVCAELDRLVAREATAH